MEWKKVRLGDIATIAISGVDKKCNKNECPVKLCNFVDVYRNWAITKDMEAGLMSATASSKEIEQFSIKRGQVAITKDSETRYDIGLSTYIADDFSNVLLGYHCALIHPNENVICGEYLNAFFHTSMVQQYFAYNATGSGMRYTLSVDTINQIPLLLPPLDYQRKAAGLLTNLDRKIALNRAINHNLEAMAKQLYDYWFVQFDFPDDGGRPYKSSGGEMVWNERLKREIPKGWEDCNLQKLLTIKNGRDHKSLKTGSFPVYGSGGKMRDVDEFMYNGESVLMPRKGSLNNVMYVNEAFWTVDTMFYSVMKEPCLAKYVYYSIKDIDFARMDVGTGVPSMTSSTLYSIVMVKPHDTVLENFDALLTPLYRRIKQNEENNISLTTQRDTLLPLLMNGQVSVNSD